MPSKEGKASRRPWPRAEAPQVRWTHSVLLFPRVTLGLCSIRQGTLFSFLNLLHTVPLQGPDSWIAFHTQLQCHPFSHNPQIFHSLLSRGFSLISFVSCYLDGEPYITLCDWWPFFLSLSICRGDRRSTNLYLSCILFSTQGNAGLEPCSGDRARTDCKPSHLSPLMDTSDSLSS